MSRIQSVKQNYQPTVTHKSAKVAKKPSFTGSLSPANQALVYDLFISKHKALNKLSETAGEVQNILFIGLGTALVAPIFIAYNPLSHQDEKTKKYSALRQPISAVIATATGLGINIPVTNAFNRMAAEGKLKKFDMEAKPPSDFLKNRYNSIVSNFSKLRERDKKYFDMVNDDSIVDVKTFKQKYPTFQEFITGVHSVSQKNAAQKLLDPKNENGLRNVSLKEFMVKNLGVKEYPNDAKHLNPNAIVNGPVAKESATATTKLSPEVVVNSLGVKEQLHGKPQLNPDFIKKYLKNTSAVVFLKEIGISTDEVTLRTFLGKNFYKDKFGAEMEENQNLAGEMFKIIKKNSKEGDFKGIDEPKLEKLFKEGLAKKGFDESERKTISRLSELWINEKTKGEEIIPLKTLFKVLGIEDDFYKHTCLDSKMDKFLLWVDKNLTDGICSDVHKNPAIQQIVEISEKETAENGKKLVKFAGQIAANAVKTAESNFKAYSKVQGIVLSLAILPLSCGALNWSYPRIMEKWFPSLAGTKVDNKSDHKADKKVEIKTEVKGGK